MGSRTVWIKYRTAKVKRGTTEFRLEERRCQLYRYGGYSFGLCWSSDGNDIKAYELSTSGIVAHTSCKDYKAPKKALLAEIHDLVDSGRLAEAFTNFKRMLADERQKLQEEYDRQMEALVFPLNEEYVSYG